MASEIGEKDGVIDNGSHVSYKDALLDGEPEEPQSDFHPDPSIVDTIHQHYYKKERNAGGKDGNNNDGLQNLKTSLLISGVVIAVVGAILVLVKKIKEKT
ncbi:hypothetical protein Leryth_014727 [Lithospermum erythrorhizon]|uniref:Uncharacterized protein n=1 Tax=Lithospermum erythrorhizon TaxID=34254 RepID=A0AAV3QDM5_LITER|nr:hypothetical protein Leryth_014727 [Lithospermum erythrorhizon]